AKMYFYPAPRPRNVLYRRRQLYLTATCPDAPFKEINQSRVSPLNAILMILIIPAPLFTQRERADLIQRCAVIPFGKGLYLAMQIGMTITRKILLKELRHVDVFFQTFQSLEKVTPAVSEEIALTKLSIPHLVTPSGEQNFSRSRLLKQPVRYRLFTVHELRSFFN